MIRLNMTFNKEEDAMINALKKDTGIKQTTELLRYLITKQIKEDRK